MAVESVVCIRDMILLASTAFPGKACLYGLGSSCMFLRVSLRDLSQFGNKPLIFNIKKVVYFILQPGSPKCSFRNVEGGVHYRHEIPC